MWSQDTPEIQGLFVLAPNTSSSSYSSSWCRGRTWVLAITKSLAYWINLNHMWKVKHWTRVTDHDLYPTGHSSCLQWASLKTNPVIKQGGQADPTVKLFWTIHLLLKIHNACLLKHFEISFHNNCAHQMGLAIGHGFYLT